MTSLAAADSLAAINPSAICASCGHPYRDHLSGAGCRHRDDDGLCSCSLFQSEGEHAERQAKALDALAGARNRDHFVRSLLGRPISPPIPAPIGADCPDHVTYPLVIKDAEAWCRRGQHNPLERCRVEP